MGTQARDERIKNFKPDDELKGGPVEHRVLRDFIFCVIFLASLVLLVVISVIGFSQGNPLQLAQPYDGDGKACGRDERLDYPYIYFPIPWLGYMNHTVCVKQCPNFADNETLDEIECYTNSKVTSCKQNGNVLNLNYSYSPPTYKVNFNMSKALFIYNSTGIFKRICVPAKVTNIKYTQVNEYLEKALGVLEKWVSDIKLCWWVILVCAFIALVVGFIYMFIMRWFVGVLIWITILLYLILLFLLGLFFWQRANSEEDNQTDTKSTEDDSATTQKVFAIIFWSVLGLSIIIICCFYTKLKLAIAILKVYFFKIKLFFQTASLYMKDVLLAIFVPIVNALIAIIFWAYWIAGFLYVYTVGDEKASDLTPFGTVAWEKNWRYVVLFFIFEGLWVNAFISAVCEFILASSVCIWYFGRVGNNYHKPLSRSLYRAFRYHFGSLAFGSFILAVVRLIRYILIYIQKKAEQTGMTDNAFIKFLLCCAHCCVACLERFIEFLNRNAYIQIALQGKSFCNAARDAFMLLMQNPARMLITHGIANIFIFIGKLFIAIFTTLIGYLIITKVDSIQEEVYSPMIPTILIFIISYVIGCLYMSIYGMAVDSILHCFILDEQISKQKGGGPQHTPEQLQEFIKQCEDKSQQQQQESKK